MDDRPLKVLEFYDLLRILKELSVSPLGQRRCEELKPSADRCLIESRLAEVIELKTILETEGDIPIGGLKDIEETLKRVDAEGAVLSVQELVDLYHQIALCKGLRRFFLKLENDKFPCLREKVSRLSQLKDLEKEILQTIDLKGEILDQASPALSDVRRRIGTTRDKAKAVLESLLRREDLQPIFQEQLITLRNGRYVLLIKADAEHRLDGIIHDQSQSRMTFFFEPLQVVTHNNEVSILMAEEKEEELRILSELSRGVRNEKQRFWEDFEILGELDLLYAMARFSILLKGVRPLLSEDGKIDLKEARNPLLSLQKEVQVVPIHLRVEDGIKTLILSGANAGGKTVALKTLGLLTLMVQSGLPIPVAEGSRAAIFNEVFAMIGDEQNIEENLSTFSSHLLHLNQILGKAGPRSLILLDELGVGTHASEGCALAMGFLDCFRETGASVVVTTHFDRLKVYGYLHPDVENVAVEFDEVTLQPRYTLAYGASGLSNAFLIAGKLGIPERVLERAAYYRDGSGEEIAQALEMLERLKADVEKEKEELFKEKTEAALERRRLKELLEGIKKRRQEILSVAVEKAQGKVKKVEEELKEWLRLQKEETARNVRPFKGRLKELHEIKEKSFPSTQERRANKPLGGIKIGEHVKIMSLRSHGVVTAVDEVSSLVEVMTEKAKVKTSFSDISGVSEEDEGTKASEISLSTGGIPPEPPTQLNVIGLTVEDALPKVDKFIDQALLHGLERVQIIHGVGSGRLRDAIGKFLDDHRGVKRFTSGEIAKGGRGVTIVELI